jgi:hypothetical protein
MSVGAPGLAPPFRWRSNVTALRHDSSFAVCTELTRSHAGACGPNLVPDMLLNHYRVTSRLTKRLRTAIVST